VSPNFSLLDMSRPEVATLVAAMTRAREAVERRSWLHPLEHAGDDWWADVLADPRARVTTRRARDAGGRSFYRLADETRATILVECTKCDWRAAFDRDELVAAHGADRPMPDCSNTSPDRGARGSGRRGTAAACTTSSRSRPTRLVDPERRTVTPGSHRACTHERGHWPNVRSWCELDTRGWRE
jgi:hypothetical protein